MFPDCSNKYNQIETQNMYLFFKKILIYTIMLMRIVGDFLEIKTENKEVKQKKGTLNHIIKTIQKSWIGHIKVKIKAPDELLNASLKELTDKINIEDMNTYLVLSNFYLHKGRKKGKVYIWHKNKKYSFNMIRKEQKDVLCCKTKRKEELNKFTLKFVRRELLRKFKNSFNIKKSEDELKSLFYQKIFNNDIKGIQAFESLDLPKEYMDDIKSFPLFNSKVKKFLKDDFINSLTMKYIISKSDFLANKNISVYHFIDEALSRQHTNSIPIQSVLNALEQFIIFYED